jgi:hypothetical protein
LLIVSAFVTSLLSISIGILGSRRWSVVREDTCSALSAWHVCMYVCSELMVTKLYMLVLIMFLCYLVMMILSLLASVCIPVLLSVGLEEADVRQGIL